MSEIAAAAKRLKINPQVPQTFINNPTHQMEVTVQKIQKVEEELSQLAATTKMPKVPEKMPESNDHCHCIESSRCPTEKMDFTFGRSCSIGFVRCCLHLHENSQKSSETAENEKKLNTFQEKPLETPEISENLKTTTTEQITTISTTEMTTKMRPLVTKIPITKLKSQKIFHVYNIPSVMPQKPAVFQYKNPQQFASHIINHSRPSVYKGSQVHPISLTKK